GVVWRYSPHCRHRRTRKSGAPSFRLVQQAFTTIQILMSASYQDRFDAGRHLAMRLSQYSNRDDVVILALPRGGVPVAFEVARALKAPLDVFLVRKLGLPGYEELAMGALASGGIRVINQDVV